MFCLQRASNEQWAARACDALDQILVDHAHCEMKAAATALSLAPRFYRRPAVVQALAALAKEELEHFEQVVVMLEERGLALGPPPNDAYVGALRRQAAATKPHAIDALVDRLLVGALIEARSCERFKLLAEELAVRGKEEAAFYRELMQSEAGHYVLLCDLARQAGPGNDAVDRRLEQLAELEAQIVGDLGDEASIHG